MARYFIAALCDVHAEREDEFNEWYDAKHVPDLLRLPGFLSVNRMVLTDFQFETDDTHSDAHYRYLNLIEIETDDLDATLAGIRTLDSGPVAEFLVPTRVMTSLYRQRRRVPDGPPLGRATRRTPPTASEPLHDQ